MNSSCALEILIPDLLSYQMCYSLFLVFKYQCPRAEIKHLLAQGYQDHACFASVILIFPKLNSQRAFMFAKNLTETLAS